MNAGTRPIPIPLSHLPQFPSRCALLHPHRTISPSEEKHYNVYPSVNLVFLSLSHPLYVPSIFCLLGTRARQEGWDTVVGFRLIPRLRHEALVSRCDATRSAQTSGSREFFSFLHVSLEGEDTRYSGWFSCVNLSPRLGGLIAIKIAIARSHENNSGARARARSFYF